MIPIQIKRVVGAVLYQGEHKSVREALESALRGGADLSGACLGGASLENADLHGANLNGALLSRADLRGARLNGACLRGAYLDGALLSRADLRGARLNGACLSGAYLNGADLHGSLISDGVRLVGARPVLEITHLGSERRSLLVFVTDHGVYLRTGCFLGTAEEFERAVYQKHASSAHGREYLAALKLAQVHYEIWAGNADVEQDQ